MILPTKGISADRALITIGALSLEKLKSPMSLSALWQEYNLYSIRHDITEIVTFDWFTYSLSMLFALGLIDWTDEGYLRRINVY